MNLTNKQEAGLKLAIERYKNKENKRCEILWILKK